MIDKTTIEVWRTIDPDYGKRLELTNEKDGVLKTLAGKINYRLRLLNEDWCDDSIWDEYCEAIEEYNKFLSDCQEYDCNKHLEFVIRKETSELARQKRRRVRRTPRMSLQQVRFEPEPCQQCGDLAEYVVVYDTVRYHSSDGYGAFMTYSITSLENDTEMQRRIVENEEDLFPTNETGWFCRGCHPNPSVLEDHSSRT